ncbi:serine hydrolase domain-containing protein [Kordiimonas aestuarii]|uniref:serine hydrolase domain-containing protein n=1 Tax=Kordiimonas aestuarii TaxID=1005925 RepID=UPI0021D06C2F|nr:serine hydrolase [Kordiimonas aestuarii]
MNRKPTNMPRRVLGAGVLLAFSCAANADSLADKLDGFMAEMEQSPYAPPSYSLAVASGDTLLYSRLHGKKVAGADAPLDMNTRLYIASVSKSFMGLLAAKLDAEGVLSLDTTLADEWPGLELPEPINPAGITMRKLLSHNFGFENDPLVIRTAYVGGTPVADFEAILEQHSVPIEPGFSYDNLGYLIYAAVLERKTGRSWTDWLKSDIHGPLGLTSASNTPSELPQAELGLGNHFNPISKTGWSVAVAKKDDMMHPAGGHFISTKDAVKWLQANLNRAVFEPSVYGVAQTAYAKREPAKKYADMSCDGYALGWQTCDYAGHRVFYHGGTYDGMMIFMVFLPDDDLVISSINGARAYGWTFGWNALQQATDYALGLEAADSNAARRLEGRVESQAGYANFRVRIREEALRKATSPEAATLRSALVGSYASPAYGAATLCDVDGRLTLEIGNFSAEILAGPEGTAYLLERAYGEPSKLTVSRGGEGGAVSFTWEGGTFNRVSGNGCLGGEDVSR